MDSIRRESEFQRGISKRGFHFEREEYLKIVLRYSKRAEGLSGEKNRVEQDKVATVEETGFQTCVARGDRSVPLPFFPFVWGAVSTKNFVGGGNKS